MNSENYRKKILINGRGSTTQRVHDTYLSIGYKLLQVRSQILSGAACYSNYKIIIIYSL